MVLGDSGTAWRASGHRGARPRHLGGNADRQGIYRGGTTGYTIGRGVAGCKLVKESTGETIGMGMAFVRDIAHIVDSIICYVGWLFPLWDNKRQTIADKIMSTVVLAQPQAK